jgi:hypothetical protein
MKIPIANQVRSDVTLLRRRWDRNVGEGKEPQSDFLERIIDWVQHRHNTIAR